MELGPNLLCFYLRVGTNLQPLSHVIQSRHRLVTSVTSLAGFSHEELSHDGLCGGRPDEIRIRKMVPTPRKILLSRRATLRSDRAHRTEIMEVQ